VQEQSEPSSTSTENVPDTDTESKVPEEQTEKSVEEIPEGKAEEGDVPIVNPNSVISKLESGFENLKKVEVDKNPKKLEEGDFVEFEGVDYQVKTVNDNGSYDLSTLDRKGGAKGVLPREISKVISYVETEASQETQTENISDVKETPERKGEEETVAKEETPEATEEFEVASGNAAIPEPVKVDKETFEAIQVLEEVEQKRMDQIDAEQLTDRQKTKKKKAAALSFAAERRKLLGTQTEAELAKVAERDNRLNPKDKILYEGEIVEVESLPFGKVKIVRPD
jgi:hypothetical protein